MTLVVRNVMDVTLVTLVVLCVCDSRDTSKACCPHRGARKFDPVWAFGLDVILDLLGPCCIENVVALLIFIDFH